MNIIQNSKLAAKALSVIKAVAPGAVLVSLLQVPISPAPMASILPIKTSTVLAGEVKNISNKPDIADAFFGSDSSSEEAETIIEKQKDFVSSREAYPASLAVVEKYANAIKSEADKQGVPEDVAIGVALLENGGSETAVSPAGALGIYQLMPATARSLGLEVNKKVDDRKNPMLSIEAGIKYLESNYERFGDWGLATWAYHAGEGNVAKALKIYAKANDGINLPGVKEVAVLRDYVKEHGITIHKLLSDSSVQAFTKKLNDDSSGYPYKVLATASLFRGSGAQVSYNR